MINNFVDMRSDTVTQPTPEMRRVMAEAEVGDDVLMEDPTINRLQKLAAEKMGKEDGLFVASGTMGNLIAILTHCQRGDEVIMGKLAHTFIYEGGGVSSLGGVMVHTVPNRPDGVMELEDIQAAFRPDDVHHPVSRLVVLENTQNRCGGAVLPLNYVKEVGDFAHGKGMLLHIDGARIFNAAAALGVEARAIAAAADSVTFCLSKGLCAPVGSVLCGTKEFVHKARRLRKALGGGMRQAGILAAAGIYALENMVDRLKIDHQRARKLTEGLAAIPGIKLKDAVPPSNMVFATLDDSIQLSAAQVAERLRENQVKVGIVGPRQFRMVLHYWVDDDDVDLTVRSFRKVL